MTETRQNQVNATLVAGYWLLDIGFNSLCIWVFRHEYIKYRGNIPQGLFPFSVPEYQILAGIPCKQKDRQSA